MINIIIISGNQKMQLTPITKEWNFTIEVIPSDTSGGGDDIKTKRSKEKKNKKN